MSMTNFDAQGVKSMIADNQLPEALAELMGFTQQLGLTKLYNQLVLQSAKLQQYQTESRQGNVDYADLTRTRVNISLALLDLVDQLPNASEVSKPQALRGLPEWRFKRQLTVWLLLGKLLLFLYIFTIWQSGGLTFDGFLGTIGIVFPIFATYLSTAYLDLLKNRHEHSSNQHLRINRSIQWTAYGIFTLYYLAIATVLYLNTIGEIPDPGKGGEVGIPTYKNLYALLTLTESIIGVYIGQLIFTLFKKDPK